MVLPDSRIKSIPETGGESNSGDVSTEWNIDEQDDWFASVLCSEWKNEDYDESTGLGTKSVELGTKRQTYRFIKKYSQEPVEWQSFKNEQLNQLQISLAVNSFAKLTWSFMGANHPKIETENPITSLENVSYGEASTTKSFKTLEGYLYIGDETSGFDKSKMTQNRQSSDFSLTINNNMEKTDALFETEAIEQSLGDFEVSGSMDVYKSGDFSRVLNNDAIDGKEKYILAAVERTVGDKKYTYEIRLIAHLDSSSESKDGNKLKNTINYTVGRVDGLKILKTVATVE